MSIRAGEILEVGDAKIYMYQNDFSLNIKQSNAQGRGEPDHVSIPWNDIAAFLVICTKVYDAEK